MNFSGGPVVKTLHFHCRGHGFDPRKFHMQQVWPKKKTTKNLMDGHQIRIIFKLQALLFFSFSKRRRHVLSCLSLRKTLLDLGETTWKFLFIWNRTYICIWETESCLVMSDSLQPQRLYRTWNSPGQNIGVGSLSLLQEIFPTQGLNWGLLHCRQIIYQLNYQGSPLSRVEEEYSS